MARRESHPLFHGISEHIVGRIEAGELAPGDRLPSERWLGESFGVSRTTVRRALDDLVASGAVEARGRALYVARGVGTEPQNTLLSLTELAHSRGLRPTARVLTAIVRPATLDEADALRIAPGADLFELSRLRMLDDAAIAVDHNRVPLRLLPGALEIDFTTASIYASVTEAGHPPVQATLQIEARAATDREAELLELPPAAPVLVSSERTADEHDQALMLGVTVYRSDRHRFLANYTLSSRARR